MSPLCMIRQVKKLLNLRMKIIEEEIKHPYCGPFAVVLPAEFARAFSAEYPSRQLNGVERLLEITGFEEVRFVKGCAEPRLVILEKKSVPKDHHYTSR